MQIIDKKNKSDIRPIMISRALVGDLFIGLSPKTLANLNSQGLGPTGYKVGGRKVFYLIDDLKEWAMKRKIRTCKRI